MTAQPNDLIRIELGLTNELPPTCHPIDGHPPVKVGSLDESTVLVAIVVFHSDGRVAMSQNDASWLPCLILSNFDRSQLGMFQRVKY